MRRVSISAMTRRRSAGVLLAQYEISLSVRWQPAQKPVAASTRQSRMHGDSSEVSSITLLP